MDKHERVLSQIVEELRGDKDIQGVLLMGSIACGCADEHSDLDLMVLCRENRFEVRYIDNVVVEIIYATHESCLQKLGSGSMEVYHYLQSRIIFDDGRLTELMGMAQYQYAHYMPTDDYVRAVAHWLRSAQLKLTDAVESKNAMRSAYYASTNIWKVLEGIWIVNHKPMPPSASVLRFYPELTRKPCENWFEKLFSGNGVDPVLALEMIDWILDELGQNDQ